MIRLLPLLALAACTPTPEAPALSEGPPQASLTCAVHFALENRPALSEAFARVHARQTGRSVAGINAEAAAFRDDPDSLSAAIRLEMRQVCGKRISRHPETRPFAA